MYKTTSFAGTPEGLIKAWQTRRQKYKQKKEQEKKYINAGNAYNQGNRTGAKVWGGTKGLVKGAALGSALGLTAGAILQRKRIKNIVNSGLDLGASKAKEYTKYNTRELAQLGRDKILKPVLTNTNKKARFWSKDFWKNEGMKLIDKVPERRVTDIISDDIIGNPKIREKSKKVFDYIDKRTEGKNIQELQKSSLANIKQEAPILGKNLRNSTLIGAGTIGTLGTYQGAKKEELKSRNKSYNKYMK